MQSINQITADDLENFSGTLDSYQKIATKSAIYPGQDTPLGLAYVALKLNGEAGEFAEHVGKAMRDDGFFAARTDDAPSWYSSSEALTNSRRDAIIKEIGDVLWYCSAAGNELGIGLEEIARINLGKLYSRTLRGKLSGSGDER